MNTQRLKKLQASIKNPLLIKKKENLFYLTGQEFDHRAEEYLLVTKKDAVAFGSGLEKINWIKKVDSLKNIGKYLPANSELDIEWGFTYGEGKYLQFKLKDKRVKIKPTRTQLDIQRTVKDADEIGYVRKSMQIVEQVFMLVRKEIKKPQMTEVKLAQFIQSNGLRLGAGDLSFPAIVASGQNAAIPHHVPGNKKLKAGESIILDFGFKYKNYCSDFTRTVFLKKVPQRLEMAYNQVEKAYNESIELVNRSSPSRVHPRDPLSIKLSKGIPRSAALARNGGVTGNDVYQKSVDVLKEKNLDKYFIHSLGHGTGLEIHELPNLSPKSKDILKNGMVFSIEPGVYFPKVGGIRIEDLLYLEDGKCRKFINVSTNIKAIIF